MNSALPTDGESGGCSRPPPRLKTACSDSSHDHTRRQHAADEGDEAEFLLRQEPRPAQRLAGRGHQPRDGADRALGLRQIHIAAHAQPHARNGAPHAPGGRNPAGRREYPHAGRHQSAPPGGHGIPEAQSVSQIDLRKRGLRLAHQRPCRAPGRSRGKEPAAAPRCGTK